MSQSVITYEHRSSRDLHIFKKAMRSFPLTKPANSFSNRHSTQTTTTNWRSPPPIVAAERLAVVHMPMPMPAAIPGNVAQVMHMIHWPSHVASPRLACASRFFLFWPHDVQNLFAESAASGGLGLFNVERE